MALRDSDRAVYFAELRRFVGKHHGTIAANRESMDAAIRAGPLREAPAISNLLHCNVPR